MKHFLIISFALCSFAFSQSQPRAGSTFNPASPGAIGATTPGTGAFTTLTATGNTQLGDALTDTVTIGISGILINEAANTLALRNGVTAQKLSVYNTYTDASNYERAVIHWASNDLYLGTDKAGTGQSRRAYVGADNGLNIRPAGLASSSAEWQFTSTGVNAGSNLLFSTDNAYDIGATGATRPRDVFLGGKIVVGTTVRLKGYTVATLPAGTQGDYAFVTDALAPAFLVAIASGGSAKAVVFYDGTNWVAE